MNGLGFIEMYAWHKYEEFEEKLKERKENEIWVTELVQCPKKAEFSRSFPPMFMLNPSLIVGDIIHVGLEKLLEQIYEAHKVETEVEVEKELDGKVIKGRIDAIVDDLVVEIKFTRALQGEIPLEHHKLQLRVYKWMTGKRKGVIIYISPDGIKEWYDDKPVNEAEIRMLLENQDIPRYEWECDYCLFKPFCEHAVSRRRGERK